MKKILVAYDGGEPATARLTWPPSWPASSAPRLASSA